MATTITTFISGITTAACVWYGVNSGPSIPYPLADTPEITQCCLPHTDFQNPYYSLSRANADFNDQIETIHGLVSKLIENTQDLDPRISKLIDDNFWELG